MAPLRTAVGLAWALLFLVGFARCQGTSPPSSTAGSNASSPSAETLAIYEPVRSQSLGLLAAVTAGNLSGLAPYVAPDAEFLFFNTTGPVGLGNVTVLGPALSLFSPPAGSNATANFSEFTFQIIDKSNIVYVDEASTAKAGNVYLTAAWQRRNVTQAPGNGTWLLISASVTPAPNDTITVFQTIPTFITAPTSNNTLNTSTAPLLNTSFPTNVSTQAAVLNATDGLLAAISDGNRSLPNVTAEYLAPYFQIVLPTVESPVALNLTDPTFVGFFNLLRNSSGVNSTAPPPSVLSFKQLSDRAALQTVSVPAVPSFGNVYILQLWQYLARNSTTTGNTTTASAGNTWLLTFASVNIAPASIA